MQFSCREADTHSANQEIRPLNNHFFNAKLSTNLNSITARYAVYNNGNTIYKVTLSLLVKHRCTPGY